MALAVHDERLTRRVGFAVLLAAALTVVFVVMIWPRLGQAGLTVRVRFGVVVGLPAGAPVRVAGKDVGHVRSIGISRDPRDPRGQAGVVAVLSIDPEWADRIPRNADFFVDARSLLAPRYIAIGPPPGHAAPERALRDGDEIDGIDPPSLDNVLQRTWDTLEEVSRFMDAIQPAAAKIDASAGRLAATIASLDPRPGASEELRRSVAEAAGAAEQLVEAFAAGRVDPAAIAALAARVSATAARIETSAAELRVQLAQIRRALELAGVGQGQPFDARLERAIASADRALAAAEQLAGSVRGVVEDATTGHGALAAFGADLELVDDVKELTKELKRQPWRVVGAPAR